MRIKRISRSETILFEDVGFGDVLESREAFYIKCKINNSDCNAILLNDGRACLFGSDAPVKVIDGHFQETED